LPAMASPTYFTPDKPALLGMTQQWVGADTTVGSAGLSVFEDTVRLGSVKYVADMAYKNTVGDGDAIIGIGSAVAAGTFSSFNGIQMSFMNTNNSNWSVNVWAITTDGTRYDNGWVLLQPYTNLWKTVILDFAAESVNGSLVTSYGFEVKGYMDADPAAQGNPSNGDQFHMNVSPVVPVPGAVILGGIGAGIVGWFRRKKSL